MKTNIIAVIAIAVTTNWVQVKRIDNQCDQPGCLAIHYDEIHEVAYKLETRSIEFDFEGQKRTVLLSTQETLLEPHTVRVRHEPLGGLGFGVLP